MAKGISQPSLLACLLLAACATIDSPAGGKVAQYCSAENAYRLGSQARVYLGGCPKESEPQFLAGLQRGRQVRPWAPALEPYYARIELAERELITAASEPERERVRARLRDLEWWALHLLHNKATFHD
jgi:hypothetical protein